MTIPLFRLPYIVQKLIILQISMTEVINAAVVFKVFARLVQSVNFRIKKIEWMIPENGENDDRIELFHTNKYHPSFVFKYNTNIEFFDKLGDVVYENANERLGVASSFFLSLFKPKYFSVIIRRNVENFQKFCVWKFSRTFNYISIAPFGGSNIEMSLDDISFLFEETESRFYDIDVKCPSIFKGQVKCGILGIVAHFKWIDLANLLSNNCQIERLGFSEHPKNFTMIDVAKAWLTGRNTVLKKVSIGGEFQQEEVDEIIRQINANPTVLSKEELEEQCVFGDCKAWDIMRNDGSKASFHEHSFSDYLIFIVWNKNLLQKYK